MLCSLRMTYKERSCLDHYRYAMIRLIIPVKPCLTIVAHDHFCVLDIFALETLPFLSHCFYCMFRKKVIGIQFLCKCMLIPFSITTSHASSENNGFSFVVSTSMTSSSNSSLKWDNCIFSPPLTEFPISPSQ